MVALLCACAGLIIASSADDIPKVGELALDHEWSTEEELREEMRLAEEREEKDKKDKARRKAPTAQTPSQPHASSGHAPERRRGSSASSRLPSASTSPALLGGDEESGIPMQEFRGRTNSDRLGVRPGGRTTVARKLSSSNRVGVSLSPGHGRRVLLPNNSEELAVACDINHMFNPETATSARAHSSSVKSTKSTVGGVPPPLPGSVDAVVAAGDAAGSDAATAAVAAAAAAATAEDLKTSAAPKKAKKK